MLLWAMWAMVNMVKGKSSVAVFLAVVFPAVSRLSRRAGDHLQQPSTPLHPIACRTRPLAPPKSQSRPLLLLYKLSRASSSPHFDLPDHLLLHTPSPPLIPPPIHRGASFCALKLLRTIQSLVGYILPSHQFLHSIHFLFLKPILAFAPPSQNLTCTHLRCHHSSALDSLFILQLAPPLFSHYLRTSTLSYTFEQSSDSQSCRQTAAPSVSQSHHNHWV